MIWQLASKFRHKEIYPKIFNLRSSCHNQAKMLQQSPLEKLVMLDIILMILNLILAFVILNKVTSQYLIQLSFIQILEGWKLMQLSVLIYQRFHLFWGKGFILFVLIIDKFFPSVKQNISILLALFNLPINLLISAKSFFYHFIFIWEFFDNLIIGFNPLLPVFKPCPIVAIIKSPYMYHNSTKLILKISFLKIPYRSINIRFHVQLKRVTKL